MASSKIKDYVWENRQEFLNLIAKGNTPHQATKLMGVNVSAKTSCDYLSMILGYQNELKVVQEAFKDDLEPTYKSSFREFLIPAFIEKKEFIFQSKINFDN